VNCNLSAPEMLGAISEFSRSDGHGPLAILAIFSHGKDGMIYGHDKATNCSVQEIIDNFNLGHVKNIPKVIFGKHKNAEAG